MMYVIRFLRLPLSLLTMTLFFFPEPTTASCECGYLINTTKSNSTSTTNAIIFNNVLESDFLHLSSLTDNQDWIPQKYIVSPALARGPYGKNASLSNIVANPLQSAYDWAGTGTNNSDAAGLQLYVRAGSTAPAGSLIGMSELVTNRSDVLYGSFRVGMKVTSINGTCSAFFFYRNDTQEIDIELLSAQQQSQNPSSHVANLVLQSTQSLQAGFNAAGTPGFLPYHLPFDPTTGFHEYRYDWTPNAVSFYADGILLDSVTTPADIPSSPGGIHFSHWSNGDPTWSGGPPESDAVLTLSYFKAYFNTSADNTTAPTAPTACGQAGPNAACNVLDVAGAPDSNASARAAWFADGGDGKTWNGTGKVTGTTGPARGKGDAVVGPSGFLSTVAGLVILWGAL